MRRSLVQGLLAVTGILVVGTTLTTTACGAGATTSEFEDETMPPPGDGGPKDPLGKKGPGECTELECMQVECDDPNVTTTVSGIVYAPNGTLPLYNAIVYVPNKPLDALADGSSCDRCGSVTGQPIASTVTGADGRFVLKNAPVGKDIPLVVQVGKWRRELKFDVTEACVDNPITDTNKTRLPRNQSEGHLPRIAVTTGRCDQLACLLPKLGIDPDEYTPSDGNGRLHVYRGAADKSGGAPSPIPAPAPSGSLDATSLWSDINTLNRYDMVLMSCECGEHNETKPAASKQAIYDYASAGGRVFASHFHYAWAQTGPLNTTAQWRGGSGDSSGATPPYFVDTSFPKGAAFAQWLVNVDATSTLGQIPISQPREDVGRVYSPTQRWVYSKHPGSSIPEATKYLNVNTPVGTPVAEQCGKFVFADMHLYGGDVQPPVGALPDDAFPESCSTEMTPEEKALAFLFFDLSSCVGDDTKPPRPPIK